MEIGIIGASALVPSRRAQLPTAAQGLISSMEQVVARLDADADRLAQAAALPETFEVPRAARTLAHPKGHGVKLDVGHVVLPGARLRTRNTPPSRGSEL